MFDLIDNALDIMIENLDNHYYDVDPQKTIELENQINEYRNQLRKDHVHDIESEKYAYSIGTLYKDIFTQSEKMGDNIHDVTMAMVESGK